MGSWQEDSGPPASGAPSSGPDDAFLSEGQNAPAQPSGTGAAGQGQVRASVDAAGRVVDIEIVDAALTGLDRPLGEVVRTAVNAALDDLAEQLAEGDLVGLDGELARVTAECDRALDRVYGGHTDPE